MQLAIAFVGAASVALAWRAIVAGRTTLFRIMPALHTVLGVLAVAMRGPALSGDTTVAIGALVGLASGVLLYLATRVFLSLVVERWPDFGGRIAATYANREPGSRVVQFILAVGISVPGEELFWRGLVTPRLQASLPVLSGPGLAWIMYSAANAASGELPIVMGALVGGALWGALAVLTEGVLAPILCHAAWTGLMLLAPPGAVREKMTP